MKRLFEFLKTATVTGLFVLLPTVVVIKLLAEVVGLARKASVPILAVLPDQIVDNPTFPGLFAVVVILIACFVAGVLARLAFVRKVGSWIDRNIFQVIPGYRAIKNITSGLRDSSDASAFRAAVLTSPESGKELVYLVEDHGDGMATIMIPSVPTPMAGAIKIVRRERVEVLDVKISAIARVLTQWGVGTSELLRREKSK